MDKELEKVRWACRRGMLECDLFLVPFFENCYGQLSIDEQEIFKKLLVESDTEIFAWLMATENPTNKSYVAILDKIRNFKQRNFQA